MLQTQAPKTVVELTEHYARIRRRLLQPRNRILQIENKADPIPANDMKASAKEFQATLHRSWLAGIDVDLILKAHCFFAGELFEKLNHFHKSQSMKALRKSIAYDLQRRFPLRGLDNIATQLKTSRIRAAEMVREYCREKQIDLPKATDRDKKELEWDPKAIRSASKLEANIQLISDMYFGDEFPVMDIAVKIGVSNQSMTRFIRDNGWTRPNIRAGRAG